MIFILSENSDHTTNEVIDWLCYLKKDYVRLNDTAKIDLNSLSVGIDNSLKFFYNGEYYEIKPEDSYWYRRGHLSVNASFNKIENEKKLFEYLHKEYSDLILGLHAFLYSHTDNVSSYLDNYTNKISSLFYAQKAGIVVPKTIITGKKDVLLPFYKQCNCQIITKAIYHGGYYDDENSFSGAYTSLVVEDDIDRLPSSFNVSLFQEKVDKVFELRIFYLEGETFSSAIFSQSDKQTEIDFRNYNEEKPNRIVPFMLPKLINDQIVSLMKSLNMNSGSIDMIYSNSYGYVFLEVNPIGQFKQVSFPCNYYLEYLLATKL